MRINMIQSGNISYNEKEIKYLDVSITLMRRLMLVCSSFPNQVALVEVLELTAAKRHK